MTDYTPPPGLTAAAAATGYARAVNITTLTNAGLAAAAALAGAGGVVVIPPNSTLVLTAAATLTDVGILGSGLNSRISVSSLGAGMAALTITSTGAIGYLPVGNFEMVGAGTAPLGTLENVGDGLVISGTAKVWLRNARIRRFDKGLRYSNTTGHIAAQSCEITQNYYGVYVALNSFDYAFTDCEVNGNTFANFATPADQGFASCTFQNVHAGFAPYGFYQEPTPINQGKPKVFMQEVYMRHVRFEQIGNAAILTDAQQDATNASITSNLHIEEPGFSWSPASGGGTYKIAARDRNYAVVLSQTDRLIEIIGGANPFTAGTLNVIRVKQAGHQALALINTSAASANVTTDAGAANVYAGTAHAVLGADVAFAQVTAAAVAVTAGTGYVQLDGSNARIGGSVSSGFNIDHGGPIQARNSGAGFANTWTIDASGRATFVGGVSGGAYATGARPAAATAGAGRMVYDTTLSKPIWSDGTVWRDAAGTAV